MKGDSTVHSTNKKYREGWDRIFAPEKPETKPLILPPSRKTCVLGPVIIHGFKPELTHPR